MQEAKFGAQQFHDPRPHTSNTQNFLIPRFHGPKNSKFRVKLEGSQCRFQICKESKVPGCSRAPELQDSKVAGLQGSNQGCRFPWFQSSKISEFRGLQGSRAQTLCWSPCRKNKLRFRNHISTLPQPNFGDSATKIRHASATKKRRFRNQNKTIPQPKKTIPQPKKDDNQKKRISQPKKGDSATTIRATQKPTSASHLRPQST